MLRIDESAKNRFKACKTLARNLGPEMVKKFAKVLRWLNAYACHEGKLTTRVTLYLDFAPYSFGIVWERKDTDGNWKHWFIGGLIYHGPHDNGGDGGAPTLSVNLTPHHGWSVHT